VKDKDLFGSDDLGELSLPYDFSKKNFARNEQWIKLVSLPLLLFPRLAFCDYYSISVRFSFVSLLLLLLFSHP
jgi:hypothetical protein